MCALLAQECAELLLNVGLRTIETFKLLPAIVVLEHEQCWERSDLIVLDQL